MSHISNTKEMAVLYGEAHSTVFGLTC